uniref:Uncharacterized protein n=1 Tax=Anguilla anguilla TaxID=7936 RepID=A0A0E9VET8_ANGAN
MPASITFTIVRDPIMVTHSHSPRWKWLKERGENQKHVASS